MRFLSAMFWEYVQNAPALVCFIGALWHWARDEKRRGVGYALGGALAAALLIRYTEPLASGYLEPLSVTFINLIAMGILELLLAIYLAAETSWSNWQVDLGIGALAGLSLGMFQGVASPDSPLIGIVVHSVALGLAGVFVLVGARKLKNEPLRAALAYGMLLAVVMTLAIGVLDYGYYLIG
mgnify:CR=1 FL=1